jgi:pilus assembly protein Flp/PilA
MKTWMSQAKRTLADLHREDSGQDLIEYALIAALIALAAIVTMKSLGNSINAAFSTIGARLSTNVT